MAITSAETGRTTSISALEGWIGHVTGIDPEKLKLTDVSEDGENAMYSYLPDYFLTEVEVRAGGDYLNRIHTTGPAESFSGGYDTKQARAYMAGFMGEENPAKTKLLGFLTITNGELNDLYNDGKGDANCYAIGYLTD